LAAAIIGSFDFGFAFLGGLGASVVAFLGLQKVTRNRGEFVELI